MSRGRVDENETTFPGRRDWYLSYQSLLPGKVDEIHSHLPFREGETKEFRFMGIIRDGPPVEDLRSISH